jgi:hypothetical protein
MDASELPVMLLGMTESVASGELEPSAATAITTLIKTALAVDAHITWQRRIGEVERMLAKLNETAVSR